MQYIQTVQNQHQYTKISLLWFSGGWYFCHFLSIQQFNSSYFTTKHINSERKIEDLQKQVTGTTKFIWKEMSKWKNASMKMHHHNQLHIICWEGWYTDLCSCEVCYLLPEIRKENKLLFYYLWHDSNVICCRVAQIFKRQVWKTYSEENPQSVYLQQMWLPEHSDIIPPSYADLCKKQFQFWKIKKKNKSIFH